MIIKDVIKMIRRNDETVKQINERRRNSNNLGPNHIPMGHTIVDVSTYRQSQKQNQADINASIEDVGFHKIDRRYIAALHNAQVDSNRYKGTTI